MMMMMMMQISEREADYDGDDEIALPFAPERRRFSFSLSSSCVIPFSPLLCVANGVSRRSFSYDRLPQEPLRLTVLKLDGSIFDVVVVKTATVAELKLAVESAFSHLPKTGPGKVSWSHVWSQFCLSYDGQKLVTDTDTIGIYGIKDGDQLRFIRHLSINYNMGKIKSEKKVHIPERPNISGERGSFVDRKYNDQSYQENFETRQDNYENSLAIRDQQRQLAHFKEWSCFSYRRLRNSEIITEQRHQSSKQRDSLLGSLRTMVRIYCTKLGFHRSNRLETEFSD